MSRGVSPRGGRLIGGAARAHSVRPSCFLVFPVSAWHPIGGFVEREYLGSAGYGTEEYRGSGVKASRFTAAASPAVATDMVLWWLAGARTVITVAVLLAAGILIAATLVTR